MTGRNKQPILLIQVNKKKELIVTSPNTSIIEILGLCTYLIHVIVNNISPSSLGSLGSR